MVTMASHQLIIHLESAEIIFTLATSQACRGFREKVTNKYVNESMMQQDREYANLTCSIARGGNRESSTFDRHKVSEAILYYGVATNVSI